MTAALKEVAGRATRPARKVGARPIRHRCIGGDDADDEALAGVGWRRAGLSHATAPSKSPASSKAKRILIVEDEMITALAAKSLLRTAGYEVVGIVTSAAGAIRRADETRPDLILMDIRLRGDSDGIAAAEEIRKRFDLPSLFLSAYGETNIRERADAARPVGFITKPYSPEELLAAIRGALRY